MNAAEDLALVLPALLRKRVVNFTENDDSEQVIIFVGREGTAPRVTQVQLRGRERCRGRTSRTAAPPWWPSVRKWNSRSLRDS